MQKVTAKRSVSKFVIITNLSSTLRDTSQKCTANTSFDIQNTIQNNEVSPNRRHFETLWRHFISQQLSAKCLQNLSLDFAITAIWRHLAFQIASRPFSRQLVNFEVSLSVSRMVDLSLPSVSEVSPHLANFYQVSPEREVTVWQF